MQFRCNEPTIAFEILEEDVIVINLESGTYYSIIDCGAAIWSALLGGMTVDAIADRLTTAATTGRDEVATEVKRFVDELVNEQLIVPAEQMANTGVEQGLLLDTTFTPPKLQKFTDMQELLLVDPIHEVSEEGWPVQDGKNA